MAYGGPTPAVRLAALEILNSDKTEVVIRAMRAVDRRPWSQVQARAAEFQKMIDNGGSGLTLLQKRRLEEINADIARCQAPREAAAVTPFPGRPRDDT